MGSKRKWTFYENRWKFREFYFHKALRRHIFEKYFNKDIYIPFYANQWVLHKQETNNRIAEMIRSGKPFMVARFGNTELCVMDGVLKRRLFGTTPETEAWLDEWNNADSTLTASGDHGGNLPGWDEPLEHHIVWH